MFKLNIQPGFAAAMPADQDQTNNRRQVKNAAFSYCNPKHFDHPFLIHTSTEAAQLIGLGDDDTRDNYFLELFSGQSVYPGTRPYAMAYAGHQFGHWAGQLGDGRAINLFEVKTNEGQWTVQLKGAGSTPYSRHADGLAVLRSSIREHLCSEAMHHLGVPTTRSLCLIGTSERVIRDMFYDGHPAPEPGAILCRLSPTFIRFGSFEIFAAQKDEENLKKLMDYTIRSFFPEVKADTDNRYLDFFQEVCARTIDLVTEWKRVGFVHGVMNTDNMSITGLTLDYGPYGWIDNYDEDWTPNTTDAQHRRYRFGTQDQIALWNLYQLANAIFPCIGDAAALQDILDKTEDAIGQKYYTMMARKLGLNFIDKDVALHIDSLRQLLQHSHGDMTIFFRTLSYFGNIDVRPESTEMKQLMESAFYGKNSDEMETKWQDWFAGYQKLIHADARPAYLRQKSMQSENPRYVLRNYMAQMAINKAYEDDYTLVEELYEMLKNPYSDQPKYDHWYAKRPDWALDHPGSSMLSCSS